MISLGINPETSRGWVAQAEVDAGTRPGVSTASRRGWPSSSGEVGGVPGEAGSRPLHGGHQSGVTVDATHRGLRAAPRRYPTSAPPHQQVLPTVTAVVVAGARWTVIKRECSPLARALRGAGEFADGDVVVGGQRLTAARRTPTIRAFGRPEGRRTRRGRPRCRLRRWSGSGVTRPGTGGPAAAPSLAADHESDGVTPSTGWASRPVHRSTPRRRDRLTSFLTVRPAASANSRRTSFGPNSIRGAAPV